MSLIADALKRAQDQRSGGRDDGARRLLTPSGPLRVQGRRRAIPRSLGIAGLVLAASVVAFAAVVILSPRAEIQASTALAAGPPAGMEGRPSGTERLDLPEPRLADGSEVAGSGAGSGAWGGGSASGAEDPAPLAPSGPAGAPVETAEAVGGSSFRLALSGGDAAADLGARALSAQRRGDHERAAELYREAIGLHPSNPQLQNNLGTVYRALGLPWEAYRAFEAAVAADPDYAPAWSNLGLVLDGLGRPHEAEDAYREALQLDPLNVGARVNLANAYAERGDVAGAMSQLRAALDEDPALPEAHYAMARLLEATGDVAGARRHFTAFLVHGAGRFAELEARVRERLAAPAGGGG